VASSKNRQRALARAKAERQIARRAAKARRRRQLQAGLGGGLVVLLILLGVGWQTDWFGITKPKPVASDDCLWTTLDAGTSSETKEVGKPPTRGIPKSGTKHVTITLNHGVINAQLDLAKAPCTAASLEYLSSKDFFTGTLCHRLTSEVLQCGDPSATGRGGPTYKFPDENLPQTAEKPDPNGGPPSKENYLYPRGTLAMANSGPSTNGSQFFLVYKDVLLPPDFTIFGTITAGLEVIDKIGAGGITPASADNPNDGKPTLETKIEALMVTDTAPPAPSTAATPSATASASS
jgi:peptidyl-prolyl cis-trans isomerase B (cyclophilin B)